MVVILWIGVVFWNRLVKLYRLMVVSSPNIKCFVNKLNSVGLEESATQGQKKVSQQNRIFQKKIASKRRHDINNVNNQQ